MIIPSGLGYLGLLAVVTGAGGGGDVPGDCGHAHYDVHGVSFDYHWAGSTTQGGIHGRPGRSEGPGRVGDAFYEKANDGIIWVAASDIGVTVTEKRLERLQDRLFSAVTPEATLRASPRSSPSVACPRSDSPCESAMLTRGR